MTFCPGKKQETALSGPWDRDLGADLAALKEWGASVLVSLMEAHEFEELSVRDLGERAEALDLEWHHLPIQDVKVPDARFESRWAYSGSRLRRHLEQDRGVVLHCKGGLGRTGTVAARLLVERGTNPEDAIREVRAARPGAIETAEQEDYVRGCGPVRRDRELGCLLGGAVGDGLGYTVEFSKLPAIRARFGPEGIRFPVYQEGRLIVSDDTQMTMFTLEGLLRGPVQAGAEVLVEEIRKAYMDWLATQQPKLPGWRPAGRLHGEPCMQHQRAPGTTCISALAEGGWGTLEKRINDRKGCGGVMRVAPIGLMAEITPGAALDIGARAAAITHGHPTGFWSSGAMAAMVALIRLGSEPDAAAREVVGLLEPEPECRETVQAVTGAQELAHDRPEGRPEDVRILGEGWIGEEALAIGLYSVLCGKSFPDVLAIAANHGGDSDSTASVAGQLYGAWRGLDELPHAWVKRLDVFDPLVYLAAQIP